MPPYRPEYTDETIYLWVTGKFRDIGIHPSRASGVDVLVETLKFTPVEEWDQQFEMSATVRDARLFQLYYGEERKRQEKLAELSANLSVGLAAISLVIGLADIFGFSVLPSPEVILEWIIQASPYLITPIGIMGALTLFACRGYLPKLYGTTEIIVGVMTVNATAGTVTLQNVPSMLPFLGGIYVIIRGLDNLAKALDPGSRLARYFGRLFNNPARKTAN